MTKQSKYQTINADDETHYKIKKLALYYRTTQIKLMNAIIKVIDKFKPEMQEELEK